MSPADELRAAAQKIRETADGATGYPTPWHVEAKFGVEWLVATPEPHLVASGTKPIADWIALTSPALAGPLADLLEKAADHLCITGAVYCIEVNRTLAVARAINGGAR